jgi:hypothetical protein
MALFDELRSFLAEVETQQVKAASSKKRAEAHTEAGSYEGGTSHPVKSVDDSTSDAHEGARSAENTSDVKKQVPAGGVDSAPNKTPKQQKQQFDVGITSAATGEDPSHEDDYKGTKDDPGTSHPAKTEDGEKYSSMSFERLKELTEKKANALIAGISVAVKEAELHGNQDKLDVNPKDGKITGSDLKALRDRKGHTAQEMKKATAIGYDQAVEAGVPAAEDYNAFFKQASENMLRGALEAASVTGQYLTAFNQQLATKLAEEEGGEEPEKGESESHEKSESPAHESAEDAGGEGLGLDEADMAGMEGGAPGGGMGGEEGSIDELLAALAEMGVSPEEVMAALGGEGAGLEAGGLPPGAEMGLPPEAAPKMAAARKTNNQVAGLMKAAKSRARSGKFRISEAKTAGQRQLREEIKKCIAEIVG